MSLRLFYAFVILCFVTAHALAILKLRDLASSTPASPAASISTGD